MNRRNRRTPIFVVLGLLGSGCDPGAGSEHELDQAAWVRAPLVELADAERWVALAGDEDPLADHRPAEVDCPPGAWQIEHEALEIQTGVCNYLALAQPSLVELEPGDRVVVDLWHELLDAPEPALGHVALFVGDELVDEAEVAIPSPAAVIQLEGSLAQAHSAGTPVIVHLHNHGFNAWSFVTIDAERLE